MTKWIIQAMSEKGAVMNLEELEDVVQTYIAQERQDIICYYAIHFMPNLIAVAKAAKTYMNDTDWPNRESGIKLLQELENLECKESEE